MAPALKIPDLKPEPRPEPSMMSACETGGCGGGPAPAPRTPPPVFSTVRVNGVEIDADAIAREIQHHPAADADSAWRKAATALAVRELLLQRARELDLQAAPEADAVGRQEEGADAVISALLAVEVIATDPGEAECRRYYEANRDRFRTADLFEASHILIEPAADTPEAWAAAGVETRRIAQEVGNDAAAFAAAAREFSTCPSAQQDGTLGQVRRGELVPEVQEAIEALAPGTASSRPVRSRHGWHVIRLARRIEGHVLPFEAVRSSIADMLAARSWTTRAAGYVAGLAGAAAIEGVNIGAEDLA